MNTTVSIQLARPSDLQAIQSLLAGASLPWQDIQNHLGDFLVARSHLEIVGCVGLERAGDSGLLRSLAVAPSHQRAGLGSALCAAILDRARDLGFTSVYLLTITREAFFKKFGFSPISRAQAPHEISQTTQFLALCPSTAILMSLPLSENSAHFK
jgi:amino-acid N-acetyltransferase